MRISEHERFVIAHIPDAADRDAAIRTRMLTRLGELIASSRRLLVEAAWHHRRPSRPTKTMRERWDLAPATARARGHAGNQRLHERWLRFNEGKKRTVIANVAVARELAGWCWSLAMIEDPAASAARR